MHRLPTPSPTTNRFVSACLLALCLHCVPAMNANLSAQEFEFQLRDQTETAPGSNRYHRRTQTERWNPAQTAVIVCDVWDLHHSINAVRRVGEFAPRLDRFLAAARAQGATIIHSPSDCMDAYADHPARRRAVSAPTAANLPQDIASWCSRIPEEERAAYPIDQSDGGDDDDPAEHAVWAAKLAALGRNAGTPWKRQSDLITIDPARDYISDRGDEVWNVLEQRGITNVILTGVHTNMCVLGRPFGLRQMARNGKHVVLVRDLTDCMYNPAQWPYVSHFTGNGLIVDHVERFVCPTITSDQLLGGAPFRFQHDTRPHIAIVIAEAGYHTADTLPAFADRYLARDCRISYVFADENDRNNLPGLDVLDDADALLLSVRRRVLPPDQMDAIRRFVQAGKPVIGLRTSSHAFALSNQSPPDGLRDWPEFDREVLGGNYHGDAGKDVAATIHITTSAADHPVLTGLPDRPFAPGYSLYRTSPLAPGTTELLTGRTADGASEPVAWTHLRDNGGRSCYIALGHPDDFAQPAFVRLLYNGIHWALARDIPAELPTPAPHANSAHWNITTVPDRPADEAGPAWYRCVVRTPERWLAGTGLQLQIPKSGTGASAWFNGHALKANDSVFTIDPDWITPDDANLIVIRLPTSGLAAAPVLTSASGPLELSGRWQFRIGDDPAWSNMPLPAKFGTATDIVFEPPADE